MIIDSCTAFLPDSYNSQYTAIICIMQILYYKAFMLLNRQGNYVNFDGVENIRKKEILEQLGNNLRSIRRRKKISQEQLSYQSNVVQSQIARIETGQLNTSICTLVVIAEALEVDICELIKF